MNCGSAGRLLLNSSTPQPSTALHLARIEVGPAEMRKFLENGTSTKVAEALKQIGYAHVTLDLQGYRRGSTNEVLQSVSASELPATDPAARHGRSA